MSTILQNLDRRVQTVIRFFPTLGASVVFSAGPAVLDADTYSVTLDSASFVASLPADMVVTVASTDVTATLADTSLVVSLVSDNLNIQVS